MDTYEKLGLLAQDSQYDLACACACSDKDRRRRGLDGRWLYPVPAASGGYGIMLKTLMSNVCANDCKYCPLRGGSDVRRCSLTPDEVATAFMDQIRRRDLIGLFLSSGVAGTSDQTMERLTAAASILRKRHQYRGFIHLKIIPGASTAAIDEALRLASAVSLNVETPGARHFEKLSKSKDYLRDIIAPIKYISEQTARGMPRSRVRCSTQFIVGASDETDREIIHYMGGIYDKLHFNRVYFSAYQSDTVNLFGETETVETRHARLTREHRLYQADFLLRRYGFASAEMEYTGAGNLDLSADPKEIWATRHPEFFPVRVHTADASALLRVPGLGPVVVERILQTRRHRRIPDLGGLRVARKLAAKAGAYLDFS
ncbi:MAG: radical SAM protein [Kiritimatiellaeota bacterium]|nr:radical SAM protein [Kiritimatiellota bacterium]